MEGNYESVLSICACFLSLLAMSLVGHSGGPMGACLAHEHIAQKIRLSSVVGAKTRRLKAYRHNGANACFQVSFVRVARLVQEMYAGGPELTRVLQALCFHGQGYSTDPRQNMAQSVDPLLHV